MRPDTWKRIEDGFFDALDVPEAQRAAHLDAAFADAPALRAEVEAMLRAHEAAGGARDSDGLLSPTSAARAGSLPPGSRVGAYELEVLIGRGGMGEVYRAHRADAAYEQRVAVKLMRVGRNIDDLMRRFRTERQILARLEHPGIATLLDGGLTDTGQPFLVMQYVDGAPITAFANERGLDAAARLRLFVTVCDAVHFAHGNLVVHRDLKPSNILVTTQGEARLLDFGIAKLLDGNAATGSTTGDLLLLTPEHAAPEQFLGAPITTGTDVYALGVLLYELLAGTRPFQLVPAIELHRAVCDQDPVAPSHAAGDPDRLANAGLAQAPVGADRIAGDLDSIVLKALRKDPARRYHSAADLAADVRRHLNGFPVQARPETFGYTASRFLKRHRVGVLASAALLVALVALAVVSVRFAITSRAQARAIALERDVAVQVSSFLEGLFESSDPFAVGPARRDTLRVGEFLDEGSRKVRDELGGQPVLQARLLTVLGQAQSDLGRLDAARPLLQEAVAIRRRELGAQASETATAERSLGVVLWRQGEAVRAESLFRSAEATFARDSIGMRRERIKAISALGSVLQVQGRYPESEAVYRHALELAEAEFGPRDSEYAGRLSDLATVVNRQARREEAESLLRRAVAVEREANGSDHPRVAGPLNNLGSVLRDGRQFAAAESVFREAVTILQARLPSPHPLTATAMNNLATALLDQRKLQDAEAMLRETLAMRRALFGERHPEIGFTLLNLAAVFEARKQPAAALPVKQEALAMLAATLGPGHPTVAIAHNNVGVSLHQLGRHREALSEYESALAIRRDRLGPTHPLTINAMAKAGQCLIELRRYPEAERRLQEAFRGLEPRQKQEAKQWDALLEQLARLYRVTGREAEAVRYQAMRPVAAG